MKLLFICNQNKHRSKTAEELFKSQFETASAGLYNETPVTKELVEGADIVLVMEEAQRKVLSERFPKLYLQKQIISLDIQDVFQYQQPELVSLLKEKMASLQPLFELEKRTVF